MLALIVLLILVLKGVLLLFVRMDTSDEEYVVLDEWYPEDDLESTSQVCFKYIYKYTICIYKIIMYKLYSEIMLRIHYIYRFC
jgi:hypothetical protein